MNFKCGQTTSKAKFLIQYISSMREFGVCVTANKPFDHNENQLRKYPQILRLKTTTFLCYYTLTIKLKYCFIYEDIGVICSHVAFEVTFINRFSLNFEPRQRENDISIHRTTTLSFKKPYKA